MVRYQEYDEGESKIRGKQVFGTVQSDTTGRIFFS